MRRLGSPLRWLHKNGHGVETVRGEDTPITKKITRYMEYLIVVGVAVMMTAYVLILGRYLKDA